MALQPVDLVVAVTAAWLQAARGAWAPAEVQRTLDLPWSTLSRSLDRLREAGIVREGRIRRIALATLLPALRYVFPLKVDPSRTERGVAAGFANEVFEGRIRYEVAQVWPTEAGSVLGHAVEPLHPGLPAVARRHPDLGAVFALIDGVRGGRAREVGIATEKLRSLLALPAPYGDP